MLYEIKAPRPATSPLVATLMPLAPTGQRTVAWQDPRPDLAATFATPPLENLRRLMAGEMPPPPMAVLMNMQVLDFGVGRVMISGLPGEEHLNPLGTIHAGFAMTLLDTAMALAVYSRLPAGTFFSTIELKANFDRPITPESGPVICDGRAVQVGKTLATAEARIEDEGRHLLTHGLATWLLVPPDDRAGDGVVSQ